VYLRRRRSSSGGADEHASTEETPHTSDDTVHQKVRQSAANEEPERNQGSPLQRETSDGAGKTTAPVMMMPFICSSRNKK